MRTHVIKLFPNDDVVSTKDKMGWCKEPRILLVVPENKHLFTRLDIVRLRRHSQNLGTQLALVSRNNYIKWAALESHVPIFESVEIAQRTTWRRRNWGRLIRGKKPTGNLQLMRPQHAWVIMNTPRQIILRSFVFFCGCAAIITLLIFLFQVRI